MNSPLFTRILYAFIGVVTISLGLKVYKSGGFYFRHLYADFSESKLLFSSIFIAIGAVFFLFALAGKEKSFEDENRICPNCDETYRLLDINEGSCPKCNIPTEPMTGYFQRHPGDR